MKAEYCVDYLSHQWNCDDLITTYRETRKQRLKYSVDNTTYELTKNKKSEQCKSIRFQNALWRSMSRHCNKLGQTNELIDPSTVSWQKESDITWLYGPMYTNSSFEMENSIKITYNDTQLKPVLKKQVTQLLPNCSDTPISNRSSFSSAVHFNPEIIEIEYQPEYPVCIEHYEEEEDALWSLLLQTSLKLSKQKALYPPQLILLFISMMKSVVSLTTTWLLYHSLSSLSWLTKKSNTAGQSISYCK